MPKYKTRIKDYKLIVQAKFTSGDQLNEREFDFFYRKNIRGFLKAQYVKKFLFTGIEYTGPIGITLAERMDKTITKYDFFFIMEQIADLVQKAKANSLPLNKIVWDINNVYINETTRELQFIYLPLENKSESEDIKGFIERIIYSAKPDPSQNTDYITGFTYFIKGMQGYDPVKTERYIKKADRSVVETIKKSGKGQSGFMTDKQKDYYAHYNGDEDTALMDEDEATGLLEEYEATGLLDEDEATGLLEEDEDMETGLLDEEEYMATGLLDEEEYMATGLLDEEEGSPQSRRNVRSRAILVRQSTGESIQINKFVFKLGKDKNIADYPISNNSTVSRNHADVITRGNSFYIIDNGSTNGTYINGDVIPKNQEIPVYSGDELRLASEEFVFYS